MNKVMANANNYINNSRFFTAKEFIRLIDLFDNVDNSGMKLMFMTLIGEFMKYFFLFLTDFFKTLLLLSKILKLLCLRILRYTTLRFTA